MKKIVIATVLGLLISSQAVTQTFAATGDFLTDNDINRLSSFGFSQEEIQTFTPEEYAVFNEKNGYDTMGHVVEETTTFYKLEDGVTSAVSEQEAIEGAAEIEKSNSIISPMALPTDSVEKKGFIKMTLSVSKVLDSKGAWHGVYTLKNSFHWLANPTYKLTDVTGISINPNLTYIQDSEYGSYKTISAGVSKITDTYPLKANKKDLSGIAFKVDLRTYTKDGSSSIGDHSGYVAFQVKKNSGTSTNAFGHYIHLYNTVNFGIDIKSGSISVSGVTQQDAMDNTAVSWDI
ncbi:hypothetical protein GCM10008915_23420 [Bifidobacterium pullorum subsp. gallinarum]